MQKPILYSFRRCPYAMRARMGLKLAEIEWEHREVDLKNKPKEMLDISSKGTVPVLWLEDGTVIDESLEILLWALEFRSQAGVNSPHENEMRQLIQENDIDFKSNLDRYKYPTRFADVEDTQVYRNNCEKFLGKLDYRLRQAQYLFDNELSFADLAIFPFIRQFSRVEEDWFSHLPYPHLRAWLKDRVESELFQSIMIKHKPWHI